MMDFKRSEENLGSRIAGGAAMLAFGRFIVRSLSLVNLAVLARLLSPEDYGIVALALIAVGLIQVFSDVRITDALIALDDLTPLHLNTAFTIQFLRGALIAAALVLFASPIAGFLGDDAIAPVLMALSLALIFDGLRNPAFYLYQRNIDFSKEVTRDVIMQIIGSIVVIASAIYLRNYWALVLGTLAGRFCGAAMTYYRVPTQIGISLRHWREFLGFGGWLTGAAMLGQLNEAAPRILLGRLVGTAPVGIWTVGRETSALAASELIAPLRRTLFPGFSAIKHDKERLKRSYVLAQAVMFGVALPIGIGMTLVAEEIILILVGPKWADAVFVVQVAGILSALSFSLIASHSILMSLGKTRIIFWRSLFGAVLMWPAIWFGIDAFGFRGAVIAHGAVTVILILLNLTIASRFAATGAFAGIFASWRSFLSVAAMSAVVVALKPAAQVDPDPVGVLLGVLPTILAGAATYILIHLALWRIARRPDGIEAQIAHYLKKTDYAAIGKRLGDMISVKR
ncbi:MAG: lipopolysaccharide biosynthesis protein [Pacificimonas sp.]